MKISLHNLQNTSLRILERGKNRNPRYLQTWEMPSPNHVIFFRRVLPGHQHHLELVPNVNFSSPTLTRWMRNPGLGPSCLYSNTVPGDSDAGSSLRTIVLETKVRPGKAHKPTNILIQDCQLCHKKCVSFKCTSWDGCTSPLKWPYLTWGSQSHRLTREVPQGSSVSSKPLLFSF